MPWLPFMLAVMLMPAAVAWSGPMKATARGSTEPELTVDLRVTVNKQIVKPGTAIPLRLGQSIQLKEVLAVTAPKTTLRVGETVQLRVTNRLRDGSTEDLTDASTGTTYYTTDEFMLVPEPDGRVTAVGTRGKPWEAAIIDVRHGTLRGSISIDLLPAGPGPSLRVVADSTVLREGEQTQLHVYKSLPDGTRKDVTATRRGTKYLTFTGSGQVNFNVVRINDSGFASAPASLGRYNWRAIMVFVRNGEDVGWIELRVIPVKEK